MIKITHKFVIPIKFQVGQICFKRNPWHGTKKIFLDYSSAFFAIFDDFRVFWMETWTLPHFTRGSRKSGSFLRQLNGYLAMSKFRNRKYRTVLFFWNLKNELCFLTSEDQLSNASYLKIAVWRCPGSNIRYLIHFRTDSSPNISGTCELKTQNLRLETITNLLTLVNLEKK
jgi:hypothetical protein